MVEIENYEKLKQYIIARLKQGASPETIKNELRTRNINPEMVDYVLKRIETNSRIQGKDFMRYGKILGIALIVILAGIGVFYFSTSYVSKQPTTISKPTTTTLFYTGFERGEFNSTIINATSPANYSFKDYNNVPAGWTITFNPTGQFQWSDAVYHSGSKSIRMSNAGGVVATHKVNLNESTSKKFVLNAWSKANNLKNGFGFVEISYIDAENKTIVLKRSARIVDSAGFNEITLRFEIPDKVDSIYIKLKLLNKNDEQSLYEKLPNWQVAFSKPMERLPSGSIWFDELELKAVFSS